MLDFDSEDDAVAIVKAATPPLPEPVGHLERWTIGLAIVWAAFAYIAYLALRALIYGS
jgi:hypothetical protein